VCLAAQAGKLYHIGISAAVARSTLADANESRDWRIYFELAQRLITKARALYVDEDFGVELANTVYALDATTIGLVADESRVAVHRRRVHAPCVEISLGARDEEPA